MKIDHQTMLEAFEETDGRGDVLSIPREYLVLMKAVPYERFAPIFYQFIKWFVDGDDTPLEEPLANAELEGLKEHQRQNALRRRAFLVTQHKKIMRQWGKCDELQNTTEYQNPPHRAITRRGIRSPRFFRGNLSRKRSMPL